MAERTEDWRPLASRRSVLSGAAALLALAGCGREKTAEPPPQPDGPPKGSLECLESILGAIPHALDLLAGGRPH